MRNLSPENIRRELLGLPDLRASLWQLLRQVPQGRVTTYGRLAEALGDPIAARWVGYELLHHHHSAECPCFRVVQASGDVGRFVTSETDEKIATLVADGVDVNDGHVDLEKHIFSPFRTDRPLKHLREIQEATAKMCSLPIDSECDIRSVAGVDVSYVGDERAFACYAEVESEGGEVTWSHVSSQPIRFPYITSYLAYRELPVLTQLLDEVRQSRAIADLLIVDGAGIAHPRGCGIASMLGFVSQVPTIGVTKRQLFGHADLEDMAFGEGRPIFKETLCLGYATLPKRNATKPIFMSPGFGIGTTATLRAMDRWIGRRRLPDPIYWADRISRQAAKVD